MIVEEEDGEDDEVAGGSELVFVVDVGMVSTLIWNGSAFETLLRLDLRPSGDIGEVSFVGLPS